MESARCSWEAEGSPPCLFRRPQGSTGPCELSVELHQGTGGLSLLCSARICELYSLAGGAGEPSYVCSLRGTPAQPADGGNAAVAAAAGEPSAGAAPAAAAAESGAPPSPLWELRHAWPAGLAPRAAMLRLLSLAERDVLRLQRLDLLPAAAAPGGPSGAAAATTTAALTDGRAAGVPDAAPLASQMDYVRQLVARLAAEGPGSSSEGPPDPRRALLAAIAQRVLQPTPSQQQQQPATEERREPQQQGQAGAAALQRLEERVGRLEALCTEMHAMLRQLLDARSPQGGGV